MGAAQHGAARGAFGGGRGVTITVTAPGSIMLTGEHAVVYGHPALVCAVEQRITVRVAPLDGGRVEIRSEIADPVLKSLDDLAPTGPMRFVEAALLQYRAQLTGVSIDITSEINPTLGLGSSAAVTVATLAALNHMTGAGEGQSALHLRALSIVRAIQGRGSGADLAASLFGGMVAYQLPYHLIQGTPALDAAPAQITPMPTPPALSLKYAGYKTPTAEVLARIAGEMERRPGEIAAIYARMGACATQATEAASAEDWQALAGHLNTYQGLMAELGVTDETLDQIIAGASGAMAVKISGSGLGDCVVAMGDEPHGFTPAPLAAEGVIIHG